VIDGSNNNSVSVLPSPGDPLSVAINPANNRVYVANYESNAVTVIDGATNQAWTIAVGTNPYAIAVSASSNLVFIANRGSSSLSVIDPSKPFPTAPPTVAITSPSNGSVVSQTVTIQATASSGLALAGVQFQLDGANLGAQVTSSPYAISWDSTQTTDGSHTITAVAKDSAGTTATFSVTVTVANSAAGFAFTPQTNSSTSATIAPGGTATYLLSLLSGASFSGTVSITCSGAPTAAACYVIPASLSISANSTVPVTITVTTAAQSASVAQPRKGRAPFTLALALLAPFALAGWRENRRRKSIRQIARDEGIVVEDRPIEVEEIFDFAEAGCVGTAAVISPVGTVTYRDKVIKFGDGEHAGPNGAVSRSARLYSLSGALSSIVTL